MELSSTDGRDREVIYIYIKKGTTPGVVLGMLTLLHGPSGISVGSVFVVPATPLVLPSVSDG